MSGRCDFCSQPDPAWLEAAPDVSVQLQGRMHGQTIDLGESGTSVGDWASCSTCHRLIHAGKRNALMRRAALSIARVQPDTRAALQHGSITCADLNAMVARMHHAFWSARSGESRHV